MKLIYTLVSCLLFNVVIMANISPFPMVLVSELFFDADGDWFLELEYWDMQEQGEYAVDSVVLQSSSSTVILSTSMFNGDHGYLVLDLESVGGNFHIDRGGDSLTTKTYSGIYVHDYTVVFGSCEGAVIGASREGQSITRLFYQYVKCNSPSLGEPNDTTGTLGYLKGTVYDENLNPVKSRQFSFGTHYAQVIETGLDGSFQARVYARPISFDLILESELNKPVKVTPVSYNIEPDSIVYRDIYILESLLSSHAMGSDSDYPIVLYPNPANVTGQIHYKIDLPVRTSSITAEVVSMEGRFVNTFSISEQVGDFPTPNHSGVYLINFRMGGQLLASKRIIVE